MNARVLELKSDFNNKIGELKADVQRDIDRIERKLEKNNPFHFLYFVSPHSNSSFTHEKAGVIEKAEDMTKPIFSVEFPCLVLALSLIVGMIS